MENVSHIPSERLNRPDLYFNRELSAIEFNRRVLEEALDPSVPLLERVKFLSIFANNIDEFFMVRVSGLRQQMSTGVLEAPPDGRTPADQLAEIRERLLPMFEEANRCWSEDLLPRLESQGIHVLGYDGLLKKQRKLLRQHFKSEIFPVLTPLVFDPGHPFPHISNLSINLAVVVGHEGEGERLARVKVPQTLARLIRIPDEKSADEYESLGLSKVRSAHFVWLEEVVAANLDLLFPGVEVHAAYPFRITRDADLEIEGDEASDLMTAMAEVVGLRHFGSAVRLEIDHEMPEEIRDLLAANIGVAPYQIYTTEGRLGLASLMELTSIERPELKFTPFLPTIQADLAREESLFPIIRKRNVLLYHPYDSFVSVVNFLQEAARDPAVVAIKQTLYRAGPDSPIVAALMEARENGKQVAALVELKARFDEENNMVWARALEEAGVHVVYGVMGLKTHAKCSLVVRRERGGVRRYAHLGTGNYNPITAGFYTDLGFFTCDEKITADLSDLFNSLTGYSLKERYRKLLVAPRRMREEILERIDREIAHHQSNGNGLLRFKMNALVDRRCIDALYRASQAGVRVDLQVRGICCLRPGVAGVSENITVTSIVGRFLEHTRIYYFHNGGEEEIFVGSADLMPRNLDHRVETLFPVEDPHLKEAIREDVLALHFRDNQRARRLLSDGTYERVTPAAGEEPLESQDYLIHHGGSWRLEE